MRTKEEYAGKIAKLLRKAESTTPEEASALVAKAQELMTAYAIDEALLAKARGDNRAEREEIAQAELVYTGIYRAAQGLLGHTIGDFNGCRNVFRENDYSKPKEYVVILTGYQSDIDRARLLDTSVRVQCASALLSWWHEVDRSWMSKMQGYKARREFIMGYRGGLHEALSRGYREAERNAAIEVAAARGVTANEATEEVALALRSRKDQVNDWFDLKYGKTLVARRRTYSSGGISARQAGIAAGRQADVSTNPRAGDDTRRGLPA